MAGISSKAAGKLENKIKYQQYELNSDFDLNQYESFYRTYDPQIGRFNQIDPLTELAQSWTAYRYCFNNPLNYQDPSGLFESRKAAREYRREHDLTGRIRRDEDGAYSLYDKNTGILYKSGDDSESGGTDGHSNDGVVESVLVTPETSRLGAMDAYDLTGTGLSYVEEVKWKGMSTGQKSKFVYDSRKSIEHVTGWKIKGTNSSFYRNTIPKTMKGVGLGMGAVSGVLIVNDVIQKKQVRASHILDAAVTGVSFIPGGGWIIGGAYLGLDLISRGISGKSIGEHLDEAVEERFNKDNGALINWSR